MFKADMISWDIVMNKITASFLSFLVLLGVSTILGFMGLTGEMGISVVAGCLGLAFSNIDKFSSFKGGGFEAKMRDQLQAVVEKETEAEPTKTGMECEGFGITDEEKPIIVALLNPKYTWRYASGLQKESGSQLKKVRETLLWLKENSLARSSSGKTGRIWTLTSKGRSAFASLKN